MEIVGLAIGLPLREVELATRKNFRIIGRRQNFLRLFTGEGWKLRQKFETSFADSFFHRLIADIGKIEKWSRRTELLALKKQWCPGTEQKQCGHGPVAAGRRLKADAFSADGVCNLIVILNERD